MNAVKGIYTDGSIKSIEKPVYQKPVEVLIIFPKSEKKVTRLRGLCKDDDIDDGQRHDCVTLCRGYTCDSG